MKARWTRVCECCKQEILPGSHFVVFAGRPWRTEHLIAYRTKRRALTGSRL